MRAFTLIEILVYLSLLSFIFTSLFNSIIFLHDQASAARSGAEELLKAVNARDAQDIGTHDV